MPKFPFENEYSIDEHESYYLRGRYQVTNN